MRRIKFLTLLLVVVLCMSALPKWTRAADRVQVRWFVGLGAGSDEPTIPKQQAIVDEFNKSQDKIELVMETVVNAKAYDQLNTEIAADNAPDIVGPMGVRGRASFPGAWMDLSDLIKENKYDLSDFDPALVNFYKIQGEGQLGIPFAVYPSFIYVNTDLFDEAGLPYPPQKFGEPYKDKDGKEHEWNMDTLRDLAMQLTLDENGNDATSKDFDPEKITQFGFGTQFADIRAKLAIFGAGNFVDDKGKAQVPEIWVEGMHWLQDAMWKDHFYPTAAYSGSDILNKGNWFESGHIAMSHVHLWYATCCMAGLQAKWNLAVVPSYKGVTTAKLHADTFGILKNSKHPKEAFEVLTYLLGEQAGTLAEIYCGMPARLSLQKDYFAHLSENELFKGKDINWQVVADSLKYPDNPNHEEGMPNFLEASARYGKFSELLEGDPTFDIDANLKGFIADMQAIFDTKK